MTGQKDRWHQSDSCADVKDNAFYGQKREDGKPDDDATGTRDPGGIRRVRSRSRVPSYARKRDPSQARGPEGKRNAADPPA